MRTLRFLFQNYRFRSIVIRNFIILISLSILSAAMFYYFTQNLFYEQYKQNIRNVQTYSLNSISSVLDSQLTRIAQSMQMAMNDEDIIRASLNPEPQNYIRSKNITSYLSNVFVENVSLVRQAYYCVWSTQEVYTSRDAVLSLDEFEKGYILRMIERSDSNMTVFSVGSKPTYLYTAGETICLIQDFPLEKRLGTMICVLDVRQLYETFFSNEGGYAEELFIYSEAGRAIFSSHQEYPTFMLELPQESDGTIHIGNTEYYTHTGSLVPWNYLYEINPARMTVDNQVLLEYFLPFLALFLLISLVVSVYTTLHIYHPVNRLIESVQPDEGTQSQHRNEFEFLQYSYKSIVSQVGQYSETIQMVTPAVLRNLFNNLIMGRENDRKSIGDTLASLNNPFQIEDRYLVVLTRVLQPSTARLPETESNVCQLRLAQILMDITMSKSEVSAYLFSDYRGDFVTVLSFKESTSDEHAEMTIHEIRSAFLDQGMHWPYQMLLAVGAERRGLPSLSESYSEALQRIRAEQYRITDTNAVEEQEIEEASFGLNEIEYDFLKRRIRQIHNYLDEEELDEASAALADLVNEVAETVPVGDISNYYQYLIDSLLERAIPLTPGGDERILGKETIQDKLTDGSLEQTVDFVKSYCGQLLEMLHTHAGKKQNRYISTAKEYIAQNYADSSLAVNSISEYVGIHASYLGRLFRDHLGQHFTSYLNEYRVGIAMQMLKATNQSVSEIGFKTGFNSAQSFIRVFKKHTGMTPGQYREKGM